MKKKLLLLLYVFIVIPLASCTVLQKTAKQELSDGYYIKKTDSENKSVYINMENDVINIYSLSNDIEQSIDTNQIPDKFHTELISDNDIKFTLIQNSFDVDFLTIPIKLRPSVKDVPSQLNSNFNGAIYCGYRTDIYNIDYLSNSFKKKERSETHFGYSIGVFTGFGSTFMSPTNTNKILQDEYDGIVWSKGIAAIVGVNNFTIGLSLGFDNLLDRNNKIWIYESKPWFGLAFGLNLN